jgi:hypothetical protein
MVAREILFHGAGRVKLGNEGIAERFPGLDRFMVEDDGVGERETVLDGVD